MARETNVTARVLAALIVPFLLAAFVILYFYPARTGELFAWAIAARMTSFLLASAYIGGAFFFVRTALGTSWHRVAVGFLPVTTFASLMLAATLLHWTKFNSGTVAFTTWVILYATTPSLVLGAWLLNRGRDTGTVDASEVAVPRPVRIITFLVGVALLLTALALFIAPKALIPVWPWPLTELTARVTGAMFALTGVFGVLIPLDRRWSAAQIAFQSLAVALAFIVVGLARAWRQFDTSRPTTWMFAAGMPALLIAVVTLYVTMEIQSRAARKGTTAATVSSGA